MRALSRKVKYKYHKMVRSPRFIPDVERDTFLVTYPRSGTTWISCIVAELMFGVSPTSLQTVTRFVPDIHDLPVQSNVPPASRYLVKSHLPLRQFLPSVEYRRVIYLIRDPRDTLLSYHRYVMARYNYQKDFLTFVNETLCGRTWPCSWQEHVNSWLGPRAKQSPLELSYLRYEDFVQDPLGAASRLADLLELNVSRRRIAEVISATTPEMMRKKEEFDPIFPRSGLKFIGSATSGTWKQNAIGSDAPIFDLIEQHAGTTMARFGYASPTNSPALSVVA
jgi:hypothetical protein